MQAQAGEPDQPLELPPVDLGDEAAVERRINFAVAHYGDFDVPSCWLIWDRVLSSDLAPLCVLVGARSPHPQTGWRWSQSRVNPSPGPAP